MKNKTKRSIILATILFAALIGNNAICAQENVGLPGPGTKTVEQEIVTHPVLVNIAKLLNEKNANQCKMPSTNDIQWRCLGALPDVKDPTIVPSSCGFTVKVVCPHETAAISGMKISYFLYTPGKKNDVAPTQELIVISAVDL